MSSIEIKMMNIVDMEADCIVNAANEGLLQGSGVCGAIFEAAGARELTEACQAIGHCDTGDAVITPAFGLKAKYIIHAVGPRWQGGLKGEPLQLYNVYLNALALAKEHDCHSIVFPVISSGIFGYPMRMAWRKGLRACGIFLKENPDYEMQIYFVVLDKKNYKEGRQLSIETLRAIKHEQNAKREALDVDEEGLQELYKLDVQSIISNESSVVYRLNELKAQKKKEEKAVEETNELARSRSEMSGGLVEIFEDTLKKIKTDEELILATGKMQNGTVLYLEEYFASYHPVKNEEYNITVVEDTTFHCASGFAGEKKVAVLNFANPYRPGGGVKNGAVAQEECLCRSSNLYAALETPYLHANYYNWNSKKTRYDGSDLAIYSPGVTVFKDDEVACSMLPRNQWFRTDVISCAAPRLRWEKAISDDKLARLHEVRARQICEVAIANDVDILILGAFGCGAFKNPPEIVAKAMRKVLVEEGYAKSFEQVVFAIKKDHNDTKGNYKVFSEILRDNE